jgi:hypothetical protein
MERETHTACGRRFTSTHMNTIHQRQQAEKVGSERKERLARGTTKHASHTDPTPETQHTHTHTHANRYTFLLAHSRTYSLSLSHTYYMHSLNLAPHPHINTMWRCTCRQQAYRRASFLSHGESMTCSILELVLQRLFGRRSSRILLQLFVGVLNAYSKGERARGPGAMSA